MARSGRFRWRPAVMMAEALRLCAAVSPVDAPLATARRVTPVVSAQVLLSLGVMSAASMTSAPVSSTVKAAITATIVVIAEFGRIGLGDGCGSGAHEAGLDQASLLRPQGVEPGVGDAGRVQARVDGGRLQGLGGCDDCGLDGLLEHSVRRSDGLPHGCLVGLATGQPPT